MLLVNHHHLLAVLSMTTFESEQARFHLNDGCTIILWLLDDQLKLLERYANVCISVSHSSNAYEPPGEFFFD